MAMTNRGQLAAARDSYTEANDDETHSTDISVDARPVAEDDESRNSPSGASEIDRGSAAGINLRILRRPTRNAADSNADTAADTPLPVVAVTVELDAGFQRGVPIPDLPHPLLDASSKSEAFEHIRRLLLDAASAPRPDDVIEDVFDDVVDECGDDVISSDESDDVVLQDLVAVDGLKYFLGNMRFDDATMTSQGHVLS